ncbi:phosphotransferase family protein [Alteribacillus bidgolensis]|uniref:Predicted kinase, aminoglycoside phosphotransferase (APT) family n=1 Tax=Alteribacillus bidgolensis TaxID=930129 RepID=A0A1G8G480_9BACI|nr:phosphotransferase family protein [Alteribacillus bidgolensis]SDH89159.1 Predicted kinase, aminoglycoside phosphotransferase (APT) family [Alteribacillus bidgolensis]
MSANLYKDTIPVRKGEEIELRRLENYLRQEMDPFPDEELHIEQFPSGHSNLTYVITAGRWEAVLRRPPFGPVAPKAHNMKRESVILRTLHPHFPLAPKPYLYCEDKSVIGSEFFLMERRKGAVIDTEFPKGIAPTPDNCRSISKAMVEALARLHKLDYKKTELVHMTKPDGFLERQVHGWIKRYDKAKTAEIAEVEELRKWLSQHIPASPQPAVIHYDYKCNNAMFNPENLQEMRGLFDWEMTTVGDPLADLGIALSYWIEEEDPESLKQGFGKPPVTVKDGFYSRQEFAEEYAKLTGRNIDNLSFYLTFAYFKLAVIVQQIYYRYKKGQTNDERFAQLGIRVSALMTHAKNVAKYGY